MTSCVRSSQVQTRAAVLRARLKLAYANTSAAFSIAKSVPQHSDTSHYVLDFIGGARGSRTPDLLNAIQALSQLSYGPILHGDGDPCVSDTRLRREAVRRQARPRLRLSRRS